MCSGPHVDEAKGIWWCRNEAGRLGEGTAWRHQMICLYYLYVMSNVLIVVFDRMTLNPSHSRVFIKKKLM